jgi:DNA repair photolyase
MKIGVTERGDGALIERKWRTALADGKVDGVIVITKAPQELKLPLPDKVIIHCTITGLGSSVIEPNVAEPPITLAAYRRLITEYGSERVVLRIDPIICQQPYIEQALKVAKHAEGRVRISFLDAYPHVRTRFAEASLSLNQPEFHADLDTRKIIFGMLKKRIKDIEVCSEPGLVCSGCVSARDLDAMGLNSENLSSVKGLQRRYCCCAAEKVELGHSRSQCKHGCLYCYWRG